MPAINELPANYGEYNLPPGINEVPDHHDDALDDAALIITDACQVECKAKTTDALRVDDECIIEPHGNMVEIRIPSLVMRTMRSPYAEQMAQWSLEEAGLFYMAAAREAATRGKTAPMPIRRSLIGLAEYLEAK